MRRMLARRAACLLLALTGCTTTFEGRFRQELFGAKPAAAEARTPGRVGVLVRPQVQDLVHEGTSNPARGVRLPLGRIVEQAVLTSLREGLRGGVQRLTEMPPPGSGFDALLTIESVRVQHDSHVAWAIPVPVFPFVVGDSEVGARLEFELGLVDAQGRALWTRRYDGDRVVYRRPSFWSTEPLPEGLLRMAHEAAWRLSQQALADVRETLAVERNRPREF